MKIPILIASDGASWEASLLTAFAEPTAPVTVVRRCVDVLELQAVAVTRVGVVALVSGTLAGFDLAVVDRLAAADVAVVAVVERGDEAAETRLRGIGVPVLVPSDAAPAVVASVLAEAARGGGLDLATWPARSAETSLARVPADAPGGVVIAVWGPTGAPGRTTVALALADEISRMDRDVLLVDADVYGGTVAVHAGMLDEAAALTEICRDMRTDPLDAATLAARSRALRPGLRVLTGSPIAGSWPALRPRAITEVLRCARALVDVCVVDVGFNLEREEELSHDARTQRRNGATLAVLNDADLVVVVASADPIGLQRAVRGLAELAEAAPAADHVLVLNRVRRTAGARGGGSELDAITRRFAGLEPVAHLPYDRQWLDAAVSSGRTLAEVRRSSPLRREVARLAGVVLEQVARQPADN